MDAFFALLIVGSLAVAYYYMQVDFAAIFKSGLWYLQLKSPAVAAAVEFVTAHTAAADFIGIAMFGFLSKVFFLPIPSEPYLVYAYQQGANIFLLVFIMAGAGAFASLINYAIGFVLGRHVVERSSFTRQLTTRIERSKVTPLLIFGTALLPIPDVASLVFGASKVGVKKFILFTALGLLIKGYAILLAFEYIAPHLNALL